MKKHILTFLILFTCSFLMAQSPTPEDRARQKIVWLNSSLKLTDEQTEKITQIFVNRYRSSDSKLEEMFRRKLTLKERAVEMTAVQTELDKDTDRKILEVLDFDQKMVYMKQVSARGRGQVVHVVTPAPRR